MAAICLGLNVLSPDSDNIPQNDTREQFAAPDTPDYWSLIISKFCDHI